MPEDVSNVHNWMEGGVHEAAHVCLGVFLVLKVVSNITSCTLRERLRHSCTLQFRLSEYHT